MLAWASTTDRCSRESYKAIKDTYIDTNTISVPTFLESTDGRTCKRPLVVVRHTHVHLDVPPFIRLFDLYFSILIRAPRDEIQLLRSDREDERRFGALREIGRPARTGLIGRPVERSDRFEDPAIFTPRNTILPMLGQTSERALCRDRGKSVQCCDDAPYARRRYV